MNCKFELTCAFSNFTHHFYDTDSLGDVIYGLTNNQDEGNRIASIANHMRPGDGFATDGIMLLCKENEE